MGIMFSWKHKRLVKKIKCQGKLKNKVHCCNQWVTVQAKTFEVVMTCSFHSDTAWVRGKTMAVYQPQKTRQLNWPLSCSMSNSGSHVVTSDICSQNPCLQNPSNFFQEESKRETFPEQKSSISSRDTFKLGDYFHTIIQGCFLFCFTLLLWLCSFIYSTNIY